MDIPKIYHWVWLDFKNENNLDTPVPERFMSVIKHTMSMNKDWRFIIWNGRMCYTLLEQYYSWFIPTFKSYKYPIQRADAIRYFILRKFGGLYTDLDSENIQPLEPLWQRFRRADAVIAKEKMPLIHYKPTNAIMMARPGSEFMTFMSENLARVKALEEDKFDKLDNIVFNTTGPQFVIRCLKEYKGRTKVEFMIKEIHNCDCGCELSAVNEDVYFFNRNVGSWKGSEYTAWMTYRCNKDIILISAVFIILFALTLVLCARYYRRYASRS